MKRHLTSNSLGVLPWLILGVYAGHYYKLLLLQLQFFGTAAALSGSVGSPQLTRT